MDVRACNNAGVQLSRSGCHGGAGALFCAATRARNGADADVARNASIAALRALTCSDSEMLSQSESLLESSSASVCDKETALRMTALRNFNSNSSALSNVPPVRIVKCGRFRIAVMAPTLQTVPSVPLDTPFSSDSADSKTEANSFLQADVLLFNAYQFAQTSDEGNTVDSCTKSLTFINQSQSSATTSPSSSYIPWVLIKCAYAILFAKLSFTDVESGGLKFFNTIQEWSHHFKNLRVLGAATPQLSIKQLELELRQLSSLSPTCFNEMCAAVASQTLIVAFRWAEFQEQVAAHGTDACLHAHNLEQELSRTKRWAKAFRDKQASAACNAGAEECTMVLFNQAFWSQVSWIQAWLLLFQGKKHDAYLLMKSGE